MNCKAKESQNISEMRLHVYNEIGIINNISNLKLLMVEIKYIIIANIFANEPANISCLGLLRVSTPIYVLGTSWHLLLPRITPFHAQLESFNQVVLRSNPRRLTSHHILKLNTPYFHIFSKFVKSEAAK